MKLVINYAAVVDSLHKAAAPFKTFNYGALVGKVNGIVGSEIGPLPGILVQSFAADMACDIADGPSLTGNLFGIVA